MTTRNRGKQPNDDTLFAPKWHPVLTDAADDLCFLLTRGYAENSALTIVGNRYRLNKRQRNALSRISTSDQRITARIHSQCTASDLKEATVEIDGFNLLILLESALSGAFIFKGRDGNYRDISSVHGSYKRVVKTEEAIHLVGQTLEELQVRHVRWYFDQPVSNSGRLKTRLLEMSREAGWPWEVTLVFNPDKVLADSKEIVISSDGWVLDYATRWFNLGAYLVEEKMKTLDLNVIKV
ncbi:MAG: DUF434 domain-containing protein [Bacteroidota bacterium]